jgi:hypothetical protein
MVGDDDDGADSMGDLGAEEGRGECANGAGITGEGKADGGREKIVDEVAS